MFVDPFDKLLGAVEQKRQALLATKITQQTYKLPADLAADVQASLEDWRSMAKCGACGRATPPCGPARMRATGWAGSGITEDQLAHSDH